MPAAEAQTSFSSAPRASPTENYYATTDIIHVIYVNFIFVHCVLKYKNQTYWL